MKIQTLTLARLLGQKWLEKPVDIDLLSQGFSRKTSRTGEGRYPSFGKLRMPLANLDPGLRRGDRF